MNVASSDYEILLNYINTKVDKSYNKYEKLTFVHYFIQKLYAKTVNQFKLEKTKVAPSDLLSLDDLIAALNDGKPIQYICGFAFFYDLILEVNQNVLIPRSETEELADNIVQFCKSNNLENINILDIGTGSGCIALAIKSKLKNAQVTGVDIDEKAIEVAKNNAIKNNLEVHFECFDVLNYLPNKQSQQYDIIVSNPPYISENELFTMQKSVLDYEPMISLFVTDGDDLQFYKRINAFARQYLKKGGHLFYEINENNGDKMLELMQHYGFTDIELKKDMQSKDRMLVAKFG